MKTIYIFTGPVKSGKSTRLFDWVDKQPNAAGILSLIIDGKKHLYSISDKKKLCLESSKNTAIKVGRYMFDPDVFYWAQKQLTEELNRAKDLLIIDEIGYLELRGEGLEPTLSKIIKKSEKANNIKLLLVVRESLVNQVIEHYRFDNIKIINNIKELD
ncbi:MAG: hypothetical protein DRI54_00655 [Bacteroidetes bacterium]|nr:MAG: hypothetical protein DRI54_00655 [Bacteroidota bacterium]